MAVTPENGWHLTPEGLVLCEGQMKKALDLDLKEIGAGFLSDEINKGKLESIESGKTQFKIFFGDWQYRRHLNNKISIHSGDTKSRHLNIKNIRLKTSKNCLDIEC
jgi:hypothetical protein